MAIFSEILRFILSPTKTKGSKFLRLRQHIATPHGIQDQYIGYVVPVQGAGLPVGENEMCWVIRKPLPFRYQVLCPVARGWLELRDIVAKT